MENKNTEKQNSLKYILIIIALAMICLVMAALLIVSYKKESVTGDFRSESYISGVLYQESAEVAALYKQAFELARVKLDQAIEENGGSGTGLCIITDIDATLMDDSSYLAGALLSNNERKKNGLPAWNNDDWTGYYSAEATEAVRPVPGAQEFIHYAASRGVKVFFISNRAYFEMDLTVKQLHKYGFIDENTLEAYSGLEGLQECPDPDDADTLSKIREKVDDDGKFELEDGYFTRKGDYTIQLQGLGFSGDKAKRRHNVAKCMGEDGRIVLYLGDSLNDMVSKDEYKYTDLTEDDSASFSAARGNSARTQAVMDELWKDKWGTEFIVLPNAAYGDWQTATWYNQSISDQEEIEAIKQQFNENSYLNSREWYDGPSPILNHME